MHLRSKSENGHPDDSDGDYFISHNNRGQEMESSDLCPSKDFKSVKDAEQTLTMEFGTIVTPAQVEIPRKASLFRVIMERKLGIDWEHSSISDKLKPESVQTNQVQDGYADLETDPLRQSNDEKNNSDQFSQPLIASYMNANTERNRISSNLQDDGHSEEQ